MLDRKLQARASDLFEKATLPARQSTTIAHRGKRMERYVRRDLTIDRAHRTRNEHWTIRIFWKYELVFSGEGRQLTDADGVPCFNPRVTTFVRGDWEERLRSLWRRSVAVPRRHPFSRWRPTFP